MWDADIARVLFVVMQARPTVIRDVRGVRWMPRRGSPVLGSRNQRPGLRPGQLVRGREQLLVLLATLALASSHHLDGDCVVH